MASDGRRPFLFQADFPMNYRHAFHAGSFTDVVKHTVLARIVTYLKNKPAPFRLIDTHAGIGVYDLGSDEAGRTGEWRDGIARIVALMPPPDVAPILAPYLDAVRAANGGGDLLLYPGSPEIARLLSRPQDRLTLVELHPRDAETLRALYRGDDRVKAVALDGWLALGSFVPPKEKRGMVLVDPAFEDPDDFDRLAAGLKKAHRRWPGGIYCLWYPEKDVRRVDRFHRVVEDAGIRRVLRIGFRIARPVPDGSLVACGLLVVNPPYTLADELAVALPWLAETLARTGDAGYSVDWLVPE